MITGNEPVHVYPTKKGFEYGLTKREYFASMAMQAILAREGNTIFSHIAHESVAAADALINALNATK